MIKFAPGDLPVAYSMIKAAKRLRKRVDQDQHPFIKYFYFWAAFNEIYGLVSYLSNRTNQLRFVSPGVPLTRQNGSVQIPLVLERISEREQLTRILSEFDYDLKNRLILHPNFKFFLDRTPCWNDQQIVADAMGQRLNGVLNVSDTTSRDFPVWSPLDFRAHQAYLANPRDLVSQDLLAKQILDVLYTVRCNLTHGHKEYDDSRDVMVVENALPLLKIIVSAFTF